MRPLPLSYIDQVRLEEMCRALWPDEKIWIDDLNFVVTKEGSIHWFEFCITYLPLELYRWMMHKKDINPNDAFKVLSKNLRQWEDFERYSISSIDFLYEQFKKLK